MSTQPNQALIDAAASAWRSIARRHKGHNIPAADQVVFSVIEMRGTRQGHFMADGWHAPDGDGRPEVALDFQLAAKGGEEIMATLLHEAVHAANWAAGIRDTASNQRHNEKFRDRARALGLEVTEPIDWRGWAYTTMPDDVAETYRRDIERLGKAAAEVRVPHRRRKASRNNPVFRCPRHERARVRMLQAAFDEYPPKCSCGRKYVPEESA